MATFVYMATYGYDNPNRATLPFFLALGAAEAGHTPEIILANDSVVFIRDDISANLKAHGFLPLAEIMAELVKRNVMFHVCGGCAKARNITEADLVGKNARMVARHTVAEIMAAADRVVTV